MWVRRLLGPHSLTSPVASGLLLLDYLVVGSLASRLSALFRLYPQPARC